MYDDDRDALAAEYVLGTLSADEREQAEALLAIDPGICRIVREWERRLGELNVMVEAVEPPAEVWDKITTEIAGPDVAAAEPRLIEEGEFAFPPIEETSTQAAAEPAAPKPPEAVATPAPAAVEKLPEPEEHHEPEEQHTPEEQYAPDSPAPPTAVEGFEDLLAAPLPEVPEHSDGPSDAAASSLLPPEPELELTSAPEKQPDLRDEHDFESGSESRRPAGFA